MSHPIDERTAWNLVRAVPRGLAAEGRAARVPPRPDAAPWLHVEPTGEWWASTAVTEEARHLFELYLPLQVEHGWVVAQVGQSVDSRIATQSGHSHYVTGPEDRLRLHRVRALADAVVVGAGTVEADDPRLTVRAAEGRNPVRVVLDPGDRLDPSHAVFSDRAAETVVVRRDPREGRTPEAEDPEARELPSGGVHVLTLPASGPEGFEPLLLLRALRSRGLDRILVEGGGVTISRFLRAGALDRLHVAVAPLLIGSGRPAFTLDPIETLDDALRPPCRIFRLGDDVLFDFDLR